MLLLKWSLIGGWSLVARFTVHHMTSLLQSSRDISLATIIARKRTIEFCRGWGGEWVVVDSPNHLPFLLTPFIRLVYCIDNKFHIPQTNTKLHLQMLPYTLTYSFYRAKETPNLSTSRPTKTFHPHFQNNQASVANPVNTTLNTQMLEHDLHAQIAPYP